MRARFFRTVGTQRAPRFVFGPGPVRENLAIGHMAMTVGVVERDDGSIVLVDCGYSEEICANPKGVYAVMRALSLGAEATAEDAILRQLQALGYDARKVTHVLATHLHNDHVGGIADFPNAELVVSRREFAGFLSQPRGAGYLAQDLIDAGRIRLFETNEEPRYGFPASFDFFGDGELVLLDAKGHTRGSLAVAIDDGKRPYIHIGDAAYQSWEYGLAPAGPSRLGASVAWNRDELRATYGAIRAAENHDRRPIIVPAHDLPIYETLPHEPG